MILAFAGFSLIIMATLLQEACVQEESVGSLYGLFTTIIFIHMLVFGSVMHIEKYEEKNKGYNFICTMPVTSTEIVVAKFLLLLLLGVLGVGFLLIMTWIFKIGSGTASLRRSILVMAGSTSLLAGGLCYVGIFKWGYGKMKIAVFIIYIALMLLPSLSVILTKEVGGANGLQKIAVVLADMNLPLISVCTVVVFSGLMFLGIKVMKDKRV
jgi:hypothetical protein